MGETVVSRGQGTSKARHRLGKRTTDQVAGVEPEVKDSEW